jgi:hypothetical protein
MTAGELLHAVESATQSIFLAIWMHTLAVATSSPFLLSLVIVSLVFLLSYTLGHFAYEYQGRLKARVGNNYKAQQHFETTWPWKISNGVLSFSFSGLLITFGYGVLALASWLVFLFGRFLLSTYVHWWFVPILLVLTWLLFVMRVKILLLYGALEIAVGIAVISSSIGQEAAKANQSGVVLIIAVLGGVYVIIRGLDNVDKSITTLAGRMTKLPYIRLRILWECYVTRRMPSVQEAQMAALREWRSAKPKFPRDSDFLKMT